MDQIANDMDELDFDLAFGSPVAAAPGPTSSSPQSTPPPVADERQRMFVELLQHYEKGDDDNSISLTCMCHGIVLGDAELRAYRKFATGQWDRADRDFFCGIVRDVLQSIPARVEKKCMQFDKPVLPGVVAEQMQALENSITTLMYVEGQ